MHSHMHTCSNKINALMEELSFDLYLNFCYLSRHFLSFSAGSTSTLLILVFMKTQLRKNHSQCSCFLLHILNITGNRSNIQENDSQLRNQSLTGRIKTVQQRRWKNINLSCVRNISPLNSVFAIEEMGQKENRLKEKSKSRAEQSVYSPLGL